MKRTQIIEHFRVALNLIMKARLSAKVFFVMKISFHLYANKTNFRMKSFALSLAFIMKENFDTRNTETRKWGIAFQFQFNDLAIYIVRPIYIVANRVTADAQDYLPQEWSKQQE